MSDPADPVKPRFQRGRGNTFTTPAEPLPQIVS